MTSIQLSVIVHFYRVFLFYFTSSDIIEVIQTEAGKTIVDSYICIACFAILNAPLCHFDQETWLILTDAEKEVESKRSNIA